MKAALGISYIQQLLKEKNRKITNVIAQKILFFAHMIALVKYKRQLVTDTKGREGVFEAWEKGPVAPFPKSEENTIIPSGFAQTEDAKIIQEAFAVLWPINEWGLVEMTHSLDCWINHAQEIIKNPTAKTNEVIPDSEIIQDAKNINILDILGVE